MRVWQMPKHRGGTGKDDKYITISGYFSQQYPICGSNYRFLCET